MELVLISICIILLSGTLSLILYRFSFISTILGLFGILIGSIVGLFPSINTLIHGTTETIHLSWSVPVGEFLVSIDPLSSIFLIVIFGISIPISLYGSQYLWHDRNKFNLGVLWFFTSVLIASMVLVVIAQNAVIFLVAWEIMSLSSFFLVVFNSKKRGVEEVGWIYLVASQFGMTFLIIFFVLLGNNGSFNFDQLIPGVHSGLIFILGIIGFGTKAGFIPFHVWLPEAHPEAPSHISALMSGVMIKMGIYGILRSLTFFGPPPEWWGWLLLGIGLTSGIIGVLFAIAQHDLKRLLAYHSVENIGIIAIGLGIGLLGLSFNANLIVVLGFGGALLHIVNHSLFKGLLFLGAGAVIQRSGLREIDKMGGILKLMPWTAVTFLIGSIAICGLPPLNGFISEILIYLGALQGGVSYDGSLAVAGVLILAGLALIGGLAVVCFTKAFGTVFLGQPRTEQAANVQEVGFLMKVSMIMLALCCIIIGIAAPYIIKVFNPVISQISQIPSQEMMKLSSQTIVVLHDIMVAILIFLSVVTLLICLRFVVLKKRNVKKSSTWGCGYAFPTAKMQYSASSFAQPVSRMFQIILRTHYKREPSEEIFPHGSTLKSHTPDIFNNILFKPIFVSVQKLLEAFRWLQHGNVHLYILYILITLIILLFWKL